MFKLIVKFTRGMLVVWVWFNSGENYEISVSSVQNIVYSHATCHMPSHGSMINLP